MPQIKISYGEGGKKVQHVEIAGVDSNNPLNNHIVLHDNELDLTPKTADLREVMNIIDI